MTDIRMKYRRDALYDLRRLPGVIDILESHGRRIVKDANRTLREDDGYRMSSKQGRRNPQGRWAVRIYTASTHAKRSDARYNTLVRLMSSGK